MNRFAIVEDDQFEIHIKNYKDPIAINEKVLYNLAEEVMIKAQQG